MITFLIDEACLGTFSVAIGRLGAPYKGAVRVAEYSEASERPFELAGPILFTGLSLMRGRRLGLLKELEDELSGSLILNRPSRVVSRLEVMRSLGVRISPATCVEASDFPLRLRYEHPAGFVESERLHSRTEMEDLLPIMAMASYPVNRIWAVEPMSPDRSPLVLWPGVGGLDVCRIMYQTNRPCRIDDGPVALLPTREEEQGFFSFLESLKNADSIISIRAGQPHAGKARVDRAERSSSNVD